MSVLEWGTLAWLAICFVLALVWPGEPRWVIASLVRQGTAEAELRDCVLWLPTLGGSSARAWRWAPFLGIALTLIDGLEERPPRRRPPLAAAPRRQAGRRKLLEPI